MTQTPPLSEQDKYAGVEIPGRVFRNLRRGVEIELIDGDATITHIPDGLTDQDGDGIGDQQQGNHLVKVELGFVHDRLDTEDGFEVAELHLNLHSLQINIKGFLGAMLVITHSGLGIPVFQIPIKLTLISPL